MPTYRHVTLSQGQVFRAGFFSVADGFFRVNGLRLLKGRHWSLKPGDVFETHFTLCGRFCGPPQTLRAFTGRVLDGTGKTSDPRGIVVLMEILGGTAEVESEDTSAQELLHG